MKNLLKTLSFIGLSLSFSLAGQTGSSKFKSQVEIPVPQNQAKTAYVNNQEYLSANSLKGYTSYYGDSLKGFDEARIKSGLLATGILGAELQNHMLTLKRNFINDKYDIGYKPTYLPARGTGSGAFILNGKPLGGNNTINVLPCVNEDFEATPSGIYTGATSVTGWTLSSRNTNGGTCNPTNWTAGATEFSIATTPIISWGLAGVMGVIPNSPLGGTRVAQLNFHSTNYSSTRIAQQFPVTTANTLFQFAYAGYWQDGGAGSHACCPQSADQPGIDVKMFDCVGAPLSCSSLSMSPGPSCASSGVTFTVIQNVAQWTNWQVKYIDLTPYIGSCVTIEVSTSDCSFGGHYGSTLFDARCGGQLIGLGLGGTGGSIGGPVSFCAGSNVAQIAGPVGYQTYQWYAPGTGSIAAPQGTMSTLTVTAPVPNSVYTVVLVAPSGCVFTSTNMITTSTINVAGIGSSSTCANGASGSATVQGNGSGAGYNYIWINSANNATVGTAQVVNNLGPGIYSVVLSGLGSAACGSAVATTTVTTAPPAVIPLLKPFCGLQAYLGTTGGSNFRWYNGNFPIPAPLGVAPNYTVNSPINGSIFWLSYLTSQGCQDSVKFTMLQSPPGLATVSNLTRICPGGNNGVVTINLAPASGAPPGLNSYNVYALGTTPAYNASLFPTASNVYTTGGLAAGSYSVNVFDGSCKYGLSFNLGPFVYDFTITPQSVTLCPGSNFNAAITFTSPPSSSQYAYSWSPNLHMFGQTSQNAIISPVYPPGTNTTVIYSVIVTPSIVNCPITKTISVTAINPPTPTISLVPPLCDVSLPYTIIANPPGGVFSTGISGTNNPISSVGGVITPAIANIGFNNTFTYSIVQYTCGARSSASYTVSKFWTAALSSVVPPLCVTSPNFNLMNIVQNTQNGTWTGQTLPTSVVGNQFIPSNLVTQGYSIKYSTVSTPLNTCPHSTIITVPVTKTVTPYIQPVPEFCTNGALISMSVNPAGGGWLPNTNSALSNAGVITPTLVPVPGMIVTYTVADGPCVNKNTTQLNVSRFYPAGFSGTVTNLCYNSPNFNLMSIVQSTVNGVWLNSTGVQSNSFSPGILPSGVYVVTYSTASFPNPNLCADTRTIEIGVLNPPAPLITQIGPICNNKAPLQLTVTPTSGQWVATPYLSSTGLFNPALTSPGNNNIQYVIGTNSCNRQQTKIVSIEAFVPATIVNSIPNLCNTSPIMNLLPFTISGQGVWSGAGISGTNFNPNVTGSGHFVLVHKTASFPSSLCPDEATVSVNVYSLAAPAVAPMGPYCNNKAPFQLQVSPVGGLFGGPDMGIVSLGGKFNPASALIGDNFINYSITAGPCIAYAQTIVRIEKFVPATFAKYPGPFCKNDPPVNMNSFVQNPGGTWSTDPGMLGSMFHPIAANPNKNNTVTYYTKSSPTGSLCPDQSEVQIEVRENPVVPATVSEGGCAPKDILFNLPTTNSGDAVWTVNDGLEPSKGRSVTRLFTTPGKYTVQFNYSDDIGCKASAIAFPLEIYDAPKADFTLPEEVYISEPQVQLTNLTTVLSNNKYTWKITGGSTTQTPSEINPVVNFSKIGKYQITLSATSFEGCKNEITKTIEVKNNFNVYIPNSFSPNFDGLNDNFIPKFSPEGLDTKSFEMEIFDRWGHSLFYTKDILGKGWDGSVQNKGEALKEEVYVYRIKYKDMEGNTYSKMGHVSLVK